MIEKKFKYKDYDEVMDEFFEKYYVEDEVTDIEDPDQKLIYSKYKLFFPELHVYFTDGDICDVEESDDPDDPRPMLVDNYSVNICYAETETDPSKYLFTMSSYFAYALQYACNERGYSWDKVDDLDCVLVYDEKDVYPQ